MTTTNTRVLRAVYREAGSSPVKMTIRSKVDCYNLLGHEPLRFTPIDDMCLIIRESDFNEDEPIRFKLSLADDEVQWRIIICCNAVVVGYDPIRRKLTNLTQEQINTLMIVYNDLD